MILMECVSAWFYEKFNYIVYVLKQIESIIVLWIVIYNKKFVNY